VKRLLAARCDELEVRLAAVGQPSGPPEEARPARPVGSPRGAAAGSADVDERCVELAWRLEEALAAGRAAQVHATVQAEQLAAAEQRSAAASARVCELESLLEAGAAAAEEAAERALAERKVLAKEVKQKRRDLAASVEARATADAAAASAAAAATASASSAFQVRIGASLREAAALRRRLREATVEHVGSAEAGGDPLELLALCDARVVALQAEAQLLGRNSDAPPGNERGSAAAAMAAEVTEGQVRECLAELISDQVVLRRRVNQLLRAQLTPGDSAATPWKYGR